MSTRVLLILILSFLGMLLYMEWQSEYSAPPEPAETRSVEETDETEDVPGVPEDEEPDLPEDVPDLPDMDEERAEEEVRPPGEAEMRPERRVEVATDVLRVEIDPAGGTIVDLRLPEYPVSVDRPDEPFQLMGRELPDLYVAQTGLLGADVNLPDHNAVYEFDQDRFELEEGADYLDVPMVWEGDQGIRVIKTYRFHRGDYVVDVFHRIENRSGEDIRGSRYLQIQRTDPPDGGGLAFTNPERFSYMGGAFYHPEDKLTKIGFDDFRSGQRMDITGGWAAMIQHYFVSAWIPPEGQRHQYSTRTVDHPERPRYALSAASARSIIASGEDHEFTARLYAGPKLQNRLEEVADGLSLTVDYRIFTVLSKPLFWMLDMINRAINHWGWSIVVLTLLIKLVFYKLTQAQFRSMGKMRKLQPRIQALKERYGDDRQKFGQAMMDIYKKEKVNPLGGCLPILVQIPIFISLYWVLLESVELRQTSWLWVPDLSRPDPYYILPILNGIGMIVTQRLMPMGGMDPMQRKIMQWLPVVFAFLFALFPAGLVLYWATNTYVSLLQQWYILRQLDQEEEKQKR